MRILPLAFMLTLCLGCTCPSSVTETTNRPDTPEERRIAAAEYLKVAPMREMLDNLSSQMGQNMTAEQFAAFKEIMGRVDAAALEQAATDSMVKNFTIGEIVTLTQFYGSTNGKSVMAKMPKYMADVMPAIQQQMVAAKRQPSALPPSPAQ